VTSPSLALRTDVQPVQIPAKASRGRLSSVAKQTGTFLPSIVSYSLNEVNDTKHRFSGPSHRCQCLPAVIRMFVTPLSGSSRSNFLKSTGWPLASNFCARFLVASISATGDDGLPSGP
jgi:hypothetical protein